MDLVVAVATFLAGFAVGFTSGASPTPTGGSVSLAVAAFLAGVIGGVSKASAFSVTVVHHASFLVILFIVTMLVIYIVTNWMRYNGMLVPIGLGRRKK